MTFYMGFHFLLVFLFKVLPYMASFFTSIFVRYYLTCKKPPYKNWQLAWTQSYCHKIIFLLGQAFPNPMYILVLIKASYIVCSRKTWKMFTIIRKIIIRKTIIRKIIRKTWRMFAIILPLSPAPTDCFAIVLPLEKVSRPLNVQQL